MSGAGGITGFYGSKNKRKWIGLERAIDDIVETHHRQKIPRAFPNRLLGPTVKWEIFHRQQDAFNFSRCKSKELHVFAYESETFEKNTGQRLYLVASYPVFLHYYRQLESDKRLHYEVIPEGAVCKLYFDLEYEKPFNPECDGAEMMDIFIKYVCLSIDAVFKMTCSRDDILDLDASTEKKFSRHLIFQLKNACFKNNIHAGRVVLHIMSGLLKKVKGSLETDIPVNCGDKETVKLNPADSNKDDDSRKRNGAENMPNETGINVTLEKTFNTETQLSEPLECNADKCLESDVCANILDQFTVEELQKLIVKNKHNDDVLFCDTGVYTKNRNFRLFLSSKLGKRNPLVLSTDNLYKCKQPQTGDELETIFYSSLVANIEYTGNMKILTFGDDNAEYNLYDHLSGQRERNKTDHLAGYSKSPYPEVDEYITGIITQDGEKGVIRLWTYFHQGELLVYEIARYRYCHNIGRHHRSNNIMFIADLQKGVFYQKCHDPDCYRQNYKSPEWPLPSNILPANYFKDDNEIDDENDFEMDDEELLNSTLEMEKQLQQKNSVDMAMSDFNDEAVDELLVAAVNNHDNSINKSIENG